MLRCSFARSGFQKQGARFVPCGVSYHTGCLRVGRPFATRREDEAGLSFPGGVTVGTFICEVCTVRSSLGRELGRPTDTQLVALERMRILDIAHSWAPRSHEAYGVYLREIRRFEERWDINILSVPQLRVPPSPPIIPLMWCQEAYSLRPGGRGQRQGGGQVSFSTVRQLRAAVSHMEAWTQVVTDPEGGYLDQSRRLIQGACRGTDSVGATLFAKGMATRTGTDSTPSKSLLYRHVLQLDLDLREHYEQANDPDLRHQFALAGMFNTLLWTAWLRAGEGLGLRWEDFEVTLPQEGPRLGLPRGVGAVQLRLKPETKSTRQRQADMVIAYVCGSGLSLGQWIARGMTTYPENGLPTGLIFQDEDGQPWSSASFRSQYLYPTLRRMQVEGDPYLTPFNHAQGKSLEEAFWSLSSYRNGARSWVSRPRKYPHGRQRAATQPEVYEHGRWRKTRNNEDIDKVYQQWSIEDRVTITSRCM